MWRITWFPCVIPVFLKSCALFTIVLPNLRTFDEFLSLLKYWFWYLCALSELKSKRVYANVCRNCGRVWSWVPAFSAMRNLSVLGVSWSEWSQGRWSSVVTHRPTLLISLMRLTPIATPAMWVVCNVWCRMIMITVTKSLQLCIASTHESTSTL